MRNVAFLIKPSSSACNMSCKYCFYADVSNSREVKYYGNMSEEVLENLVKRAFDSATESVTFSFQGGEPTLVGLDFYKKLLSLQKQYNKRNVVVNNTIQTNGYEIDEAWAIFLAKNDFLVGLSMDGVVEIHDKFRLNSLGDATFNRVKNTACLFERYNVKFNVLCVVTEQTAERAVEVYDELKRYGYIQFIPCLDRLDGEKREYSLSHETYAKFLIETFNRYYADFITGKPVSVRNFDNYVMMLLGQPPENCAMRGRCTPMLVVEGDGSVYPCDFYVLDEWKLGDITQNSIEELLSNAKAYRFEQQSCSRGSECIKCKYFALCGGGCRRECEPIVNKGTLKTVYCEAYCRFFDACIDKMVDMAKKIKAMRSNRY